jgi:hypothetical protein
MGYNGITPHLDVFMPASRTSIWDNGVADGSFVYDIRKGTGADDIVKSVWQSVPGFRAGRTYHVSAKFNTRYGSTVGTPATHATPFVALDFARSGPAYAQSASAIGPVETGQYLYTTPFTQIGFDYSAPSDAAHVVEVGMLPSGVADELLIDDVRVEEIAPKIAVDQTSLRFPDLVVQAPNGSNPTWPVSPTDAFLKISNVGYGPTGLHFSTLAADYNTSVTGLKITGAGAASYKIVEVRNGAGTLISNLPHVVLTLADLVVGGSYEVHLQFDPPHDGNYHQLAQNVSANLVITTNDPNYPVVTIPLSANKVPVEMGSFNVE